MFSSLSNSWELAKASARVLAADKELLVFPILSAIASALAMAAFFVPTFIAGLFDAGVANGVPFAGVVVSFLYYIVQSFVVIYCNSALVGAALIRLRGGDPTVGDGLRIANQRIGAIFGYAVIAATVGMILRALASKRNSLIGQIVGSVLGMAWGLATFLVVPVLVTEGLSPLEAIRRSMAYLKKTWGEQIAGNVGIGAVTGLAIFFVFMFLFLFVMLGLMAEAYAVVAGVVAVGVVVLVALALVTSALSSIYTAAVYRYAAEGQADGFFQRELVTNAFRRTSN